jgi:hypothetical protein
MRDRTQQTESIEQGSAGVEDEAISAQPPLRQGGGAIPRLADDLEGGGGQQSASERAYDVAEASESSDIRELKSKVAALVRIRFGNNYRQAFDHYDGDHDGAVGKDELVRLLEDAAVGNAFTRGAWAKGIIQKLDTDLDGKIQWSEFERIFEDSARA